MFGLLQALGAWASAGQYCVGISDRIIQLSVYHIIQPNGATMGWPLGKSKHISCLIHGAAPLIWECCAPAVFFLFNFIDQLWRGPESGPAARGQNTTAKGQAQSAACIIKITN